MRLVALSAASAILMLSAARADECMDKAGGQAAMNACASQSWAAADKQLNVLFKEVRGRLADDAEALGLLGRTQKAWLAFRDAECAFAASAVAGGSAYGMVHDLCLAALTAQRNAALQGYLACQEGDLSCPVPAAP